jgi:hypothetical protein
LGDSLTNTDTLYTRKILVDGGEADVVLGDGDGDVGDGSGLNFS